METHSEAETAVEGARVGAAMTSGQVLILTGPLGAGKTAFVRGMAEGLGIEPRAVHSPTFTILTEYGPNASGRRLIHVDLYRIENAAEVEELGLGDYMGADCICAVEWGEKLPRRMKEGAWNVTIEDAGDENRRITVIPPQVILPPSNPRPSRS